VAPAVHTCRTGALRYQGLGDLPDEVPDEPVSVEVRPNGPLYEAFEPAEAKRLADRLELHHTPKHGSWLNMAEIELSVLSEQCLDRRLADRMTLQREAAAWEATRNAARRGVDWRFTTEDARIKLKHLYPAIQS
jgi:DDE superfamily endonuclease